MVLRWCLIYCFICFLLFDVVSYFLISMNYQGRICALTLVMQKNESALAMDQLSNWKLLFSPHIYVLLVKFCVLMLLCICISINLANFNRMECFVIRNRECWHCASKDIHLGIWGLWQEALCPYMPLMLLVQKGFQMPLGFEFSHVPVYYPLAWVSIFWMCVVCPVQWPRISCRLTF